MSITKPIVGVTCDGCGTMETIPLITQGNAYVLAEPVDVVMDRRGWTVEPSGLAPKDVLHLCPTCGPKKMPQVEDVVKANPDKHHLPSWKEMGVTNRRDFSEAIHATGERGTGKVSRSQKVKGHVIQFHKWTDRAGQDHTLYPFVLCTGRDLPVSRHRKINHDFKDVNVTCLKCRVILGLDHADVEYTCPDGHTTTHNVPIGPHGMIPENVMCPHKWKTVEDGEEFENTCMKDAVPKGDK